MFSNFLYKTALLLLIATFAISSIAKAETLSISMLNFSTYEQMPKDLQKEYINNIRKAWMEFESKYPISTAKNTQLWQRLFMETAEANDQTCIICGSILNTVNVNGKNVCPTKGKPCNDSGDPKFDGFRCGPIFGEVCISRIPISNISERGFKSASQKITNKNEYEKMVKTIALDFAQLCKSTSASNTKDGCKFLAKRMTSVTEELHIKIAALDTYNKNLVAETADSELATAPTSNATAARERRTAASAQMNGCTQSRKNKALVPAFDLLAGETCGFDNNQRLIENLVANGCGQRLKSLFSTEIRSAQGRVDGQTNLVKAIVTNVKLIERTSATEAIFSMRMLKYDLSKDPVALRQVTQKVKQIGDKFILFKSFGVQTPVTITNSNRELIKFTNMEGLESMIDAGARLAMDCSLLEDINTMQASGTSITPKINSAGGSTTGAK
ncbi:MAG: hypothetical protein V4596_08770 [Bdellovibrionota bacterium]